MAKQSESRRKTRTPPSRAIAPDGVASFVHRLHDAVGAATFTAQALVRSTPCPAIACDSGNRIVACNRAAAQLIGCSSELLIGLNFQEATRAKDIFGNRLSADHGPFHDMVSRFEALQSFKMDLQTAAGEYRRLGVSIVVVAGPAPSSYELVYLMTPIHRRRRADQLIDQILAGIGVGVRSGYTGEDARGASETYQLTSRQREVLQLLAEGKKVPEISETLCVSVNTVRSHVQSILKTLDVSNQLEAVAKALSLRLI